MIRVHPLEIPKISTVCSSWLEPLLDRLALDPTTVVCPTIDNINDNTFKYYRYGPSSVGGFKWDLTFINLFLGIWSLGWLEPLLDRIARNASTVVCPNIEIINERTLEFEESDGDVSIGGFDWELTFLTVGWLEPLLDRVARNWSNVVCPVINSIHTENFQFRNRNRNGGVVGGFNWKLKVSDNGVIKKYANVILTFSFPNVGWLVPLLDRIAHNPTNVVCPQIDVISEADLNYRIINPVAYVGGFDFRLTPHIENLQTILQTIIEDNYIMLFYVLNKNSIRDHTCYRVARATSRPHCD
ncbi:hypothetical protein SK128_023775 [Halocaridina rubra]|uniref:Uncharacterized protein n=1 Tax=Halocaridina rubra TaxID=373956 RepID=A0AAN8XJF1_HALRR